MLYALSYAIKMSYKKSYAIEGYFPYVVPLLEGLWWMSDGGIMDYANKEKFRWISMIRQPDFVCAETFAWACA